VVLLGLSLGLLAVHRHKSERFAKGTDLEHDAAKNICTKAICKILRHHTILLLMEINSSVFKQIPIIELSNVLLDFLHLQHSFLGLKLILLW